MSSPPSILIRGIQIDGRACDVRLANGRIATIGNNIARLLREPTLEGAGGALLPGLVDHHLHLHAFATATQSLQCGPPSVRTADELATALTATIPGPHQWIRGIGYTEDVAGDLDAAALDRLLPHHPVRIQHRSGALWMVNSVAAQQLQLSCADHPGIERDHRGTPTGRLWRADSWLRTRIAASQPPDLTGVGQTLARLGITAVTDATPDLDRAAVDSLHTASATAQLPQRLHLLGVPAGDENRYDKQSAEATSRVTTGPYKVVLADSQLPGIDSLADVIRSAHRNHRGVAAHCVTREALLLFLAALDDAGHHPDDRIEHGSMIPAEVVAVIARHRIRVITQPGFLADRGDDYLRDVPADDQPDLYRAKTLMRAGIPLALSSDAPYGPIDPWQNIAAATQRRTPRGAFANPKERLDPASALAAYLTPPSDPGGAPRKIQVGGAADLVLLRVPLSEMLASPRADNVAATVCAGQLVHQP